MTRCAFLFLAITLLPGCASLTCLACGDLVQQSAATSLSCSAVSSTQLGSTWEYRAKGCDQIAFYICQRSGGEVCCRRVESEEKTRAPLSPSIRHPGGPFPETTLCGTN